MNLIQLLNKALNRQTKVISNQVENENNSHQEKFKIKFQSKVKDNLDNSTNQRIGIFIKGIFCKNCNETKIVELKAQNFDNLVHITKIVENIREIVIEANKLQDSQIRSSFAYDSLVVTTYCNKASAPHDNC